LQHQLTGIRVLAFVALEWDSEDPNTDRDSDAKDDYRQGPPCHSQDFVMDVALVSHRRAIPVKSSALQLHDFAALHSCQMALGLWNHKRQACLSTLLLAQG